MKKKQAEITFNLGEEEFNRKLMIYYSWVAPVFFGFLAIIMMIDKAYVTGLILLLLSFFITPFSKKHTGFISKSMRYLIIGVLVFATFNSMYLYI